GDLACREIGPQGVEVPELPPDTVDADQTPGPQPLRDAQRVLVAAGRDQALADPQAQPGNRGWPKDRLARPPLRLEPVEECWGSLVGGDRVRRVRVAVDCRPTVAVIDLGRPARGGTVLDEPGDIGHVARETGVDCPVTVSFGVERESQTRTEGIVPG